MEGIYVKHVKMSQLDPNHILGQIMQDLGNPELEFFPIHPFYTFSCINFYPQSTGDTA